MSHSKHTGFLFSSLDFIDFETKDPVRALEEMGLVFEFNLESAYQKVGNLKGLSGAVLEELMQAAALTKEVREEALRKGRALGYYFFRGGRHGLHLQLWLDAKVQRMTERSA